MTLVIKERITLGEKLWSLRSTLFVILPGGLMIPLKTRRDAYSAAAYDREHMKRAVRNLSEKLQQKVGKAVPVFLTEYR
jgi:hypothetical protein